MSFAFDRIQAYTSQIIAMVMFALVLSADRISLQERRKEIIEALSRLPGWLALFLCFGRFLGS